MLSDHDNLLSTFGKDQESSSRNSRESHHRHKIKLNPDIYNIEPKSRYQEILSQRKLLTIIDKKKQQKQKPKQNIKKLKTESEIQVLNYKIRKSISGIAETICKSKLKSNIASNMKPNCAQFSTGVSSTNRQTHRVQSSRDLKTFQSQKTKTAVVEKQNVNLNNQKIQLSVKPIKHLSKQEYLKNSTKKKGKFFDSVNECPIKSSFSIDMNSDCDSFFKSSRKRSEQKKCSLFDIQQKIIQKQRKNIKKNVESIPHSKKQQSSRQSFRKKKTTKSIGKEIIQDTLKKEFKKFITQSNEYQIQFSKFLESRGTQIDKKEKDFLFYNEVNAEILPNFSSIEVRKSYDMLSGRRNFANQILQEEQSKKLHKLIQALMIQIDLDYDLRHAKHLFSGIEQPFNTNRNDKKSRSKWEKLNQELNKLGLCYSVQTIKKIFLPSEEEIDPFLSVGKAHDELIHSLIYAYETAEIHWEQHVFQKWHHWDLRQIDLTIENIDRQRKGFITVEDVAAYISMQAGKEYKNRDVILIYKRLVNCLLSNHQQARKQIQCKQQKKNRLKFRSLIECLIRPF